MGAVRPFVREDIPQVVDLHCRVFTRESPWSRVERHAYENHLGEMFFDNVWCTEAMPSLVWEEAGGEISGFLGVTMRTMSVGDQPLRVAVSSQFMVDRRRRATLAGVEMVRAFLAGTQDVSMADEATESARRLWEGLGGSTAVLASLHWARMLHPTRFVVSRLTAGHRVGPLTSALVRPIDALAARVASTPFRLAPPTLTAEDLDAATLHECITEVAPRRQLRPEYDEPTLKWLLDVLASKRGCGEFRKVGLRDAAGRLAGWYLAYFAPGGLGEVVQVGARAGAFTAVLDDLFHRAWRHDVLALCGRVDAASMRELSERGCFFHHRGQWMLVHSSVPGVLDTIQRGGTFLTRLEGEWCLRFTGAPS